MFNFLTRRQFTSYGKDFRVANNVVVKNGGTVGNHVAIDHGFYCTVPFEIRDYVHISPYCTVIGGKDASFKMGYFSGLAAGCRIICASDELRGEGIPNPTVPPKYRDKINYKPICISDFVIVGTNSVICPGVFLEEGVVIGANSLVLKDTFLEPWCIYAGNPVKAIRARPRANILKKSREMGY